MSETIFEKEKTILECKSMMQELLATGDVSEQVNKCNETDEAWETGNGEKLY